MAGWDMADTAGDSAVAVVALAEPVVVNGLIDARTIHSGANTVVPRLWIGGTTAVVAQLNAPEWGALGQATDLYKFGLFVL
ncbi:MAG: hypothetical protein M3443_11810 [Actinomycetota bacterium]|nr:hypothetical protein [Actinomycetota bacterium]